VLTEIGRVCGSPGAPSRDKMRAVLTTLGIIIGIVYVTLMGTAIHG